MIFFLLIVYIQCAGALIGTDFGKIYNQMVRKLSNSNQRLKSGRN